MDVQQLRSWIFEVWDPLTADRTYILFEREGATLVDVPPFSRRALLRITGTCTPALVFFTHRGRAADAARWREALPRVAFAIHEADAGAVPGGVERALKDGDRLTSEAVVVHLGAHTAGASALLVRRAGGVLFPGDQVIGTPSGGLRLPDARYAPAEKVREGIEKLRTLEFSSVLSTHGPPVWSAGKDRYLELLDSLPRPRKRFGHLVDAPWDTAYRGRLQDQMVRNELMPSAETIEEAVAHGPTTLVPAWERSVARDVSWETGRELVSAPATAAEPAARGSAERAPARPPAPDRATAREPAAKRWSLAGEALVAMPPRPRGPVETLPESPDAAAGSRFRRLDLRELLEIPEVDASFGSLDLSRDGTQVAFAWNPTGAFEIYRAPIRGEEIYQLTAAGRRSVQPRFAPDGRSLAFLRDAEQDERLAIWLVDANGSRERRLTEEGGAAHSIAWSPDGTRLAYVWREDGALGLYTSAVASGERRRIASVRPDAIALPRPVWSGDGRFIAFHGASADGAREVDIYVAPAGGGEPWRIETRDTPGVSISPEWGPGDESIAFTTDVRGRYEIAVVPVRDGRASGPVRRFREAHFDEFGPLWLPGARAIAYRRSVEAAVTVRRLFVVSRNDEPLLDAPGVHSDVRASGDGALAFTWTGAAAPNDVYVKDAEAIDPRAITRSLPSAIDPTVFVRPRHVTYAGADGLAIPGLLYPPHPQAIEGDGPAPAAIIYLHEGPGGQHQVRWDPHVQWLVNQGYAVLAPNVRGSSGYGRTLREAGGRDRGAADLSDVLRGAEWLEREGIAGRGSIGVFGAAYGAYLALLALAEAPERWAAGCGIDTILEPGPDAPRPTPDRIRAPLLLLHSADDPLAPVSAVRDFVESLRAGGKAFSFHAYRGERRVFGGPESRRDALERLTEFFDEHVKGQPADLVLSA